MAAFTTMMTATVYSQKSQMLQTPSGPERPESSEALNRGFVQLEEPSRRDPYEGSYDVSFNSELARTEAPPESSK